MAALCLAAPASALPVDVYFTGPDGMGVAEGAALAANADFGIPIIDPIWADNADGYLLVTDQNLHGNETTPFPPTSNSNRTRSTWTTQNVSDLDWSNFLVYQIFITPDPEMVDGTLVSYTDSNVGLTIDADQGWVFIHTNDGENDFYLPTILLGPLGVDEFATPYDVRYHVKESVDLVGVEYTWPEFLLGVALRPIPEPSTGLMLAAGVVLLAARRRGRVPPR